VLSQVNFVLIFAAHTVMNQINFSMKRNEFIKTVATGVTGMTTLSGFNQFTDTLKEQDHLIPVLSLVMDHQ
jgi:fluoride ion exporter CrcB/FEX